MKLFLKASLLAAALGYFVWYIVNLGPARVWNVIASIGPSAPLILVPYFVVYLVDCLAWSQTLPPGRVAFWTLFRIRWAGESVNNLIPSAYVGGEAAKVFLLRKHDVTTHEGAASAVVSKTAQTVAQLFFIICASLFFFQLAQDRPRLRTGILFIVIASIVAVTALFWVQRLGLFRMIIGAARLLPFQIRALEKKKAKLLGLDQTILGFYRDHPVRFFKATALYLGGWTLDTLEIYLVGYLLGVQITWPQALVVEAFTGVAKALGMWVPGSLGVQESGIVLMGNLLGLSDTFAAAYALIRRGRELVFAGVGMMLFYAGSGRKGSQREGRGGTTIGE